MFDKVITDMSILSFEEQVKLFMSCSHLVTIDGAHLTNILFMNENAKIYNIIPDKITRCWTLEFGLYNCIKSGNFTTYIISDSDFNDNVVYNTDIENNLKDFLIDASRMKLTEYLIKFGVDINPSAIEGYTQQVPDQVDDLRSILQSINTPTIKAMEIGFNAGHSAEIFLENSNVTLTSFDNMYWYYTPIAKNYIDITYPDRHVMVCGDSTVTVPEYSKMYDLKFDIIFIDGNHNYEYAYNDLKNCKNLAHKDTIVILDDTMYEEKWKDTWTDGPTRSWVEHVKNNEIIELNKKDYLHGRGMSWGRYNI